MSNISRRKFVRASAAAALLSLAGCGTSNTTTTSSATQEAGSLELIEAGKLTVALWPDFPPFEIIEDGEYAGLDVELAKLVGEKLGLEVEFTSIEFDAIVPAIAAGGQADLGWSGITIDPERAKQVDFSDPYYTDDICIVSMQSNADITEDNYAEALNAEGAILACQTGTTGETFAKENFPLATISTYGDGTDCFAALQAGQASAVVTNWAVGTNMLDAYPGAQLVAEIATGEEYGVAVNKNDTALLAAVNSALAELSEAGTLDELTEKYIIEGV